LATAGSILSEIVLKFRMVHNDSLPERVVLRTDGAPEHLVNIPRGLLHPSALLRLANPSALMMKIGCTEKIDTHASVAVHTTSTPSENSSSTSPQSSRDSFKMISIVATLSY